MVIWGMEMDDIGAPGAESGGVEVVDKVTGSENTTETGTTAGSEGEIEILTWAACVNTFSIEAVGWSIVVACGTRIYDDMTT